MAWRAAPFAYRSALVRGVPASFAARALRRSPASIDLNLVHRQHAAYVAALKQIVASVVELPPDEDAPDCVFIEDTAIVIGDTALITRPGAASRQRETPPVAAALAATGRSVLLPPPGALIDGGDVLFTGREVFVGLSSRTNEAGVRAVRAAFPGLPVSPVRLAPAARTRGRPRDGATPSLHLKSLMSMVGPDLIAVADSADGHRLAQELHFLSKADGKRAPLSFAFVPDEAAANAVCANGYLLHRSEFPASVDVFAGCMSEDRRLQVDTSELGKADGALTCCSLLLH